MSYAWNRWRLVPGRCVLVVSAMFALLALSTIAGSHQAFAGTKCTGGFDNSWFAGRSFDPSGYEPRGAEADIRVPTCPTCATPPTAT